MKSIRLICVFSTIILATSCMVKLDQEAPGLDLEERIITITARTETDATTKTELSEAGDGAVLWTPGDEISLFCGSGTAGGRRFTSAATEAVAITDFTGTIETITGSSEATPEGTWFWGLYPYSPTATCDGSSVTMTLSAEQVAMAGTFATGTAPSLGRSKNTSMGFYNICGGIKFSVTHEGIKKVTFQSNNGEPVAGTARVAFNEAGLPVVQEITSGTDTVTLEAPDGGVFEVGEYYYIMLFPTSLASGFSLTFETLTESTTVEMNGQITVKRAIFGRLSNVDNGSLYTPKNGIVPIPDANFKAYMVENFDTDGDGEISVDEALLITRIKVNTDNIESVKGIEYCLNLASLYCGGSLNSGNGNHGKLTALDVSNNTALTYLSCWGNQLTALDVSNNTVLRTLYCNSNQLTALDISNNTVLRTLYCEGNQLTVLDVSNNTTLIELSCSYNQLTALDVSKNTVLTYLDCQQNQLTALDVSNNTTLIELSCSYNQLTALDISKNTVLTYLDCQQNQQTALDVSKNTVLTTLRCSFNQLTVLDVSNNTALRMLDCGTNQLTSLDVSNKTALTDLGCWNNQLTALDISKNTALTSLSCGGNQLTTLDVSNNTALKTLGCWGNQLTTLDVSNNTALKTLGCWGNQLTALDVSNNTALKTLFCSPMNDSQSNNLLATLFIAPGQNIPYVTTDRSTAYIPAGTEIVEKPISGGNEGYGEEDLAGVPQAVDLGLSVKWASFNLGATSPEQDGDYYAWGEIEPKNIYTWSTYKWCNGSSSTLTKNNISTTYGTIDNKTVLDSEDDVAHVKLGGNWRLPTLDEWLELEENCIWSSTTMHGIPGRLVTSNKNGNSIFLPFAGFWDNMARSGRFNHGDYWSSSLYSDIPYCAYILYIGDSVLRFNHPSRYSGLSVRPVSE